MSSSLLLQQCPACLARLTYSFRGGRQVAVQLVSCGVLPPGLVQYCSQHSCIYIYIFIHIYIYIYIYIERERETTCIRCRF